MISRKLLVILAWLLPAAALAEAVPDLYRGEAIITGREIPSEQERGLRLALTEVLIKVSGDSRIAGDTRLQAAVAGARALIRSVDYEDRLAKKKLMDKQGTRERSYVMRVDFDPARVDAVLAGLGARPWSADRPRVLVLLAVRDLAGDYVLVREGARGYGQRESLWSIARRRGLPVALPEASDDGPPLPAFAAVASNDQLGLDTLAQAYAADRLLTGVMMLTGDGMWNTAWRLSDGGAGHSWRIDGASFDRAIAHGIETSARILAGLP
jgi:hypothetical protein